MKKLGRIFSSPYFYLFFFVNVVFLGVQLLRKQKASSLRHTKLQVALNTTPLPQVLYTNLPIENSIDSFVNTGASKTIVLRLKKNDCNECADSIINNTIRLAKYFGKKNVTILVDKSYDDDEFAMFKRLYQFDFGNIVYFKSNITELDNGNFSYYFHASKAISMAENIYLIKGIQDVKNTPQYYQWLNTYARNNYSNNKSDKANRSL